MSRGRDRVSVGEAELLGRYFFLSRKAAEGELSTRGYEELERAKGALSRNPRLESLKERFRIIYEDDLDVSPTKYQPSEAAQFLGFANQILTDPVTASQDAEVMNFSDRDDIMDAEIDMKPSMPIVEQEAVPGSEVSIGGQTYRLPRDPTAASRYQQSLLDQQAAKDAETETNFRASSELKDLEGRPPFDTMTESSLLADIRSTPSYDQGFRAGLNLRGEKPNLADDFMNLSYDADAVRRDIVKNYSGMGAAQVDDPGLIFLLGHAEAMEFAKREKEDVERDVLQQGILIEGDPIYERPR